MSNTTIVKNSFSSPFLLDKSKLSRMINIIDDKFKARRIQPNLLIEVTLKIGRKVQLTSLDELFSIDNAVHNSISVLEIEANSPSNDSAGILKTSIHYSNDKKYNIFAQVESTESDVAFQLFAELEEQIERTLLKDWVFRFLKMDFVLISLMLISVFLMFFVALRPSSDYVEDTTAKTMLEKYSGAATQEEKINFLFDYAMEQLKTSQKIKGEFSLNKYLTLQTLFVVLPILLVVGTLIYMFMKCYPYSNFLWGDYEEYYSQVISKRSSLWNLVIGSIILGIIGNLFVIGISGYLKLEP